MSSETKGTKSIIFQLFLLSSFDYIHSLKKRYLEVISHFTRFKEFNGEKKTATKTSNMFIIVPRIGTCDAGFSPTKGTKSIIFQLFLLSSFDLYMQIQLTLVISNSMGPWKKFESTIVRLKRSYEDTGSVVCLTTKGRQLERNSNIDKFLTPD
jgi:hypothetical protein